MNARYLAGLLALSVWAAPAHAGTLPDNGTIWLIGAAPPGGALATFSVELNVSLTPFSSSGFPIAESWTFNASISAPDVDASLFDAGQNLPGPGLCVGFSGCSDTAQIFLSASDFGAPIFISSHLQATAFGPFTGTFLPDPEGTYGLFLDLPFQTTAPLTTPIPPAMPFFAAGLVLMGLLHRRSPSA